MAEPWATGQGAFGLELGALRQGQKSWPSLVLQTLRLVPQCPHSRRPQVMSSGLRVIRWLLKAALIDEMGCLKS